MIVTFSVSSVVFPSLPSINSCFCVSVILIDLNALYILVESLCDCSIFFLFDVLFQSVSHLLVVDVFELE